MLIEATLEIEGYLFRQSRISARNLDRLRYLAGYPDLRLAKMAKAVLAAGQVAPGKRKRLAALRRSHPAVLELLVEAGLIELVCELSDEAGGDGASSDFFGSDGTNSDADPNGEHWHADDDPF